MELAGTEPPEPEDLPGSSVGSSSPLAVVGSEAGSGSNSSPTGVRLVARELGSIPRLLFDEPRVLAELARLGGWEFDDNLDGSHLDSDLGLVDGIDLLDLVP